MCATCCLHGVGDDGSWPRVCMCATENSLFSFGSLKQSHTLSASLCMKKCVVFCLTFVTAVRCVAEETWRSVPCFSALFRFYSSVSEGLAVQLSITLGLTCPSSCSGGAWPGVTLCHIAIVFSSSQHAFKVSHCGCQGPFSTACLPGVLLFTSLKQNVVVE